MDYKRETEMKITKSQLKDIIQEELNITLNEQADWWVKEMERVLTEVKDLHDAVRKDHPDDLETFEDYFKQNVNMNFPWITKD